MAKPVDLSSIDPIVWIIGGIVVALTVTGGIVLRARARRQLDEGPKPSALPADSEGPATSKVAPRDELFSIVEHVDGAEPSPPAAVPKAAEAPAAPPAKAVEPAPKPLKEGLSRTRRGFMARLNDLIFKRELDEDLVDDLEALLVTSDVGIKTTQRLLEDLRTALSRKEIADPAVVKERLRTRVAEIVERDIEPIDWSRGPTVVMIIGVNGVGKTTTIGKIGARLTREGKSVVLAAGDTFRAAAVEQLEVWGERAGARVVKGAEGADPASVVFDAIQQAQREAADVVLCDTAGRLHTAVNLMEELKKLRRVMNKAMEGAPHEVLLVLDATTGQNGINQAEQFKAAVNVDSIALTKLDGTAKGGVVVAICDMLGLPVRYVGIGESIDDLREFSPSEFVDALFAD